MSATPHALPGFAGGLTAYEIRHLATHILQAGTGAALHRLLAHETSDGRNFWFQCKEELGDIDGFMADVQLAAKAAGRTFACEPPHKAEALALQVHYALTITSVHSLVRNVASNLIAALAREGLWHPEQALAYARQIAEVKDRIHAFREIAPLLRGDLAVTMLRDALAEVDQVQGTYYRAEALCDLAPHLPPNLVVEAYEYATTDALSGSWDEAIEGLAPYLPETLLDDALKRVDELQDEEAKGRVLIALAPRSPSPRRQAIVRRALTIIRRLDEDSRRGFHLARIVPLLSDPAQRDSLCREVLATVRGLPKVLYFHPLRILKEVLPHLPPELVNEGYAVARNIYHADNRTEALIAILPRLDAGEREAVFREALAEARKLDRPYDRASLLIQLAESVTGPLKHELLREAEAAVAEIENDENSAWMSAKLAAHLDPGARRERLRAALAKTQRIGDARELMRTRVALASYVLPASLPEWLDRLGDAGDSSLRLDILHAVAPHLDERQIEDVLRMIRDGDFADHADSALRLLVPRLPPRLLRDVVVFSDTIEQQRDRAALLAELLSRLEGSDREGVLSRLTHLLPDLGSDDDALVDRIHAQMSEEHLRGVLARYRRESWPATRVWKLATVVKALPERSRTKTAKGVLTELEAIEDPIDRAGVLTDVMPWLPPRAQQEIFAQPPLSSRDHRDESLESVLPHLPDALVSKLITAAGRIRHRFRYFLAAEMHPHVGKKDQARLERILNDSDPYMPERILLLSELQIHVPERIIDQVRAVSREVRTVVARVVLRSETASLIVEPLRSKVLRTAVKETHQLRDSFLKARCLVRLARCFGEPDRTALHREAAKELFAIRDAQSFATALRDLAPHLTPDAIDAALNRVVSFHDSLSTSSLMLLLPFLSAGQHAAVIDKMQNLLHAQSESFHSMGNDYTKLAFALVPRLTEEAYLSALGKARQKTYLEERVSDLASLLAAGSSFRDDLLYPYYDEWLRLASRGNRIQLLIGLHRQGNVIAKLGGAEAVERVSRSIRTIGQWWA